MDFRCLMFLLPDWTFEKKGNMLKLLKNPMVLVTCFVIMISSTVWAGLDPILEPHLRIVSISSVLVSFFNTYLKKKLVVVAEGYALNDCRLSSYVSCITTWAEEMYYDLIFHHARCKKKKKKKIEWTRKFYCISKLNSVAEPISASTPQMNLSVMRVSRVWQPKTMKGDKRQDNRYNKSDVFIAGITNMYVNFRGSCMWSSARMGYVVSWYGRVVVVHSRTFNEGSWRRLLWRYS